jgi:NAD(P)-dependent dehydrogenase (short-subunit alcohol dehydrogenase family)
MESAQQTVEELRARGSAAIALRVDVRDETSIAEFCRSGAEAFGGIDILVNCAGVAYFGDSTKYRCEDWDNVINTNLRGTFLASKVAAQHFKAQGRGDIVNISSSVAETGSFEGAAYAASKAGINALTRSLALELAPFDVRVNGVAPGRIASRFRRATSGEYFQFMIDQTPLKRLGLPEEVACVVALLASRVSGFVTGETVFITGGLGAVYLKHVEVEGTGRLGGG